MTRYPSPRSRGMQRGDNREAIRLVTGEASAIDIGRDPERPEQGEDEHRTFSLCCGAA
jgi:hypothetical protein